VEQDLKTGMGFNECDLNFWTWVEDLFRIFMF